jgi:hypothetical protein
LEPWDERNSGSSDSKGNSDKSNNHAINVAERMRRDRLHPSDDQDPELEDGELPRLSLSRSTSTNREQRKPQSLQTTATSEKGSEMRRQRDFWTQLDTHSSVSNENNLAAGAKAHPDDAAGEVSKLGKRRMHHDRQDQPNLKNGYHYPGQQKQSLRKNDSSDSDDDESRESKEYLVNDQELTFCDQTLTAMEAICGDSAFEQFCGGAPGPDSKTKVKPSSASSPSNTANNSPKKAKNLNILKLHDEADSVDEHTAIEVEYVEPEDTSTLALERPENWSPSRKNAYLAAMARKAKEDFEKSQAKEMEATSKTNMTAHNNNHKSNESTPPTKDSDIYRSFSAAEKRKFLRLINSGMTPKESAEKINAERDKAKATKAKKGKLFKFWKKGNKARGQDADSVEPTPTPAGPDRRLIFPQEEKKEDDRLSVEEIGRLQKQIIPSPDGYSTSSSESANDDTRESDGSQSQSQTSTAEDELHNEGSHETTSSEAKQQTRESTTEDRPTTTRDTTEILAIASKDSLVDDPAMTQGGAPGFSSSPGFSTTAIGEPEPERKSDQSKSDGRHLNTSASHASSDPSKDSSASDKRFAVSGINYYDAVRRDVSESEPEDEMDSSNIGPMSSAARTRSQSGSRLGPILHSPRLQGFSKLVRGDSKSLDEEHATPTNERSATSPVQQANKEDRPPTVNIVTPDASTKTVPGVVDEASAGPRALAASRTSKDIDTNAAERSAESTGKAAQGRIDPQAEEEALGKMEDVLLRPVVNVSAPRSTKKDRLARGEIVLLEPGLHVVSPTEKPRSQGLRTSLVVTPTTPRATTATQTEAQNNAPSDFDSPFDIQEYLNATEVYSQMGDVNESMSVVSGKSFSMESGLHDPGSVYTQSSNFTQSSRKRRPGAAKTRLAKAKEAEKHAAKKKGWHESILAAAETNNRIWQPKLGWVGYQQPLNQGEMMETVHFDGSVAEQQDSQISASPLLGRQFEGSSLDKMHLTLPVSKKRTKVEEVPGQDCPPRHKFAVDQITTADAVHQNIPVARHLAPLERLSVVNTPGPLDEQGSKIDSNTGERKQSIGHRALHCVSDDADDQLAASSDVLEKSARTAISSPMDDISLEQSVAYSVEQFVQSMGTLSPVRPVKKKPQRSPGHVQRHATPNSKQIGWANSMMAASERIGKDKQAWDPVSGWIKVGDPVQGASVGDDFSAKCIEKDQLEERQGEASNSFGESLRTKPAPASPEPISPPRRIHPVDERDEVAKRQYPSISFNEAPVVIAPTQNFGNGRSDKTESNGKADKIPLLDPTRGFRSDALNLTPIVNVVRERVDEEDMNWFPESRRSTSNAKKQSKSLIVKQDLESNKAVHGSLGATSRSERSSGPVDVDEVDSLPGIHSEEEGLVPEEDEGERGVVWKGVVFESDRQETLTLSENASAVDIKTTGDLSKSGSSTGASQFSKTVPKLTSSKKDTSPIHKSSEGWSVPSRSQKVGTPGAIRRDAASLDATPVEGRIGAEPNGIPTRTVDMSVNTNLALEGAFAGNHAPVTARNGVNFKEIVVQTLNALSPTASPNRLKRDASRPDDPSTVPTRAPWRKDAALASSSDDVHVAQPEESGTQSAVSSPVKLRAQQWERRRPADANIHTGYPPGETRLNAATAVWVGKKVRAESAAEHNGLQHQHHRKMPKASADQTDSLFEFSVGDGASVDSQSPPRGHGLGLHSLRRDSAVDKTKHQDTRPADGMARQAAEPEPSVVSDYSDGNEINKSFLNRLAGCAGPIMAKRQAGADALAQLPFLRNKNLCGRPDVILEERESEGDGDDPAQESMATEDVRNGFTREDLAQDAYYGAIAKKEGIQGMGGSPSVVSEDFGAKTAYLEALAMKTAVSKPRKGDSRRRHRSAASDVSTTSSSTRKWRDFLDRRDGREEASTKSRTNGSEASTAAENYAAQKVEEMMAMMSSRSKSTPRSWRSAADAGIDKRRHMLDGMMHENHSQQSGLPDSTRKAQKSESIIAAEQLASARVNAMMQALAASGVEEGEI